MDKCSHEYFAMLDKSRLEWFYMFFVSIFHLSCIHCGKNVYHKERVRYPDDNVWLHEGIRAKYSKTILTQLYEKFPIVNKITNL